MTSPEASTAARTLFDKIWERHRIMTREDGQSLLFIDRHLVQDGSAPAFEMLRQRGLTVRRPDLAAATADHYVPTVSRQLEDIDDPEKRAMAQALQHDAGTAGIRFFGLDDPRQGIIHVMAPEQGLSLPGMLIVCGDSHTSTHGALGALAFGIGASEVAHVLATQTLWQRRPKTLLVQIDGSPGAGVGPKDIILAVIARIGAAGATGHVIEYAGETIRAMSLEGRMTICNMSIEAGARAGMIAPDDTTFEWLAGRPFAQNEQAWDERVAQWRSLCSDEGAHFDQEVHIDASTIEPMVTWGNSPQDAAPISAQVPDPTTLAQAEQRESMAATLRYMGLTPGMALTDISVNHVFIGSCTNGRIEDLRSAAQVIQGRHVAQGVQAWVVPGSGLVRQQAEQEGLHRIFIEAGFQWRHAGCSMCLATNGDLVPPGQRCASTSNRNFVGRQGPGSRTHLMSPAMAAAAAVTGHLCDVRQLQQER